MFENSHLKFHQWLLLIQGILNNGTIKSNAELMCANKNSAHSNMHKIGILLETENSTDILEDATQFDEKYVNQSYKDNFKNSQFFLPRKPHKHGNSLFETKKRGLSKDK